MAELVQVAFDCSKFRRPWGIHSLLEQFFSRRGRWSSAMAMPANLHFHLRKRQLKSIFRGQLLMKIETGAVEGSAAGGENQKS